MIWSRRRIDEVHLERDGLPQCFPGLLPVRRLSPDALAGNPHGLKSQPVHRAVLPPRRLRRILSLGADEAGGSPGRCAGPRPACLVDLPGCGMWLRGAWRTLGSAACTSGTGEPMKSDAEIKEDVIRELRWDPQLSEPDAIGVAAQDRGRAPARPTSHSAQEIGAAPAAGRGYAA